MNDVSKRKKRRELLEEDDSSDLSDESDDDEDPKTAAQSIKFAKMPLRDRAGSSPPRHSPPQLDASPELPAWSPTKQAFPSISQPTAPLLLPGGYTSLTTVKSRPRRDTVNSSEMSSESETTEPWPFRRQKVHAARNAHLLPRIIQEEENRPAESELDDDDLVDIDVASDLSDDFQTDLTLGIDLDAFPTVEQLSGRPPPSIHATVAPLNINKDSARSQSLAAPTIQKLPRIPIDTERPVSYVQPVSLLSKFFKTQGQTGESPFQQYAQLSGKGDQSAILWIKIYAPFSDKPVSPLELPIRSTGIDQGASTTVLELIGLALWQYEEDERTPAVADEARTVNRWTLRMIEDDEVDFDFPALGRSRPVTDYSSNNNAYIKNGNRPVRGRGRDKPWDEFALVRATDEQFEDNKKTSGPEVSGPIAGPATLAPPPAAVDAPIASVPMMPSRSGSMNPALPSYLPDRNMSIAMATLRKDSTALLDAAAVPMSTELLTTPLRSGVAKTVTIHYMDPSTLAASALPIETTSDTYIAEIFSMACVRLRIDKSMHMLKIGGTQTVAPQDRTVEALGEHTRLDMTRRRFVGIGDDVGNTGQGSPRSESPNALILLPGSSNSPAKTRRKVGLGGILASGASKAAQGGLAPSSSLLLQTLGSSGRRYNVIRKQPLSFAPSHPRTLAIEGEYVHIMPATTYDALGGITVPGGPGAGKTTSVHLSNIVGCKVSRKHPKMIRLLVYREKDMTKRYDFEAGSKDEAADIVVEIRRGVEKFSVADDI